APGERHQVPARAAADLADARSWCELELADQAVAAKQIEFPAEVIDVPLVPVHPVHAERRLGGHEREGNSDLGAAIDVEAAVTRRAVAAEKARGELGLRGR